MKTKHTETPAEMNVRILGNRACIARNRLTAAQDAGADQETLDALEAADHAAMRAWNVARLALQGIES